MKNTVSSDLIKYLLQIKNSREMEEFLDALLTPGEIKEISARLEIIKLLKQGVPQREIARRLNVAIATITRGANELKLGKFKNV